MDTPLIQVVDIVWTGQPVHALDSTDQHGSFNLVVVSHVIDHFPVLMGARRSLQGWLRSSGGTMPLAVPDRWLCFDFFRPSWISGKQLAAHHKGHARNATADIVDRHGSFTMPGEKITGESQRLGEVVPAHRVHVSCQRHLEEHTEATKPYEACQAWMGKPAGFAFIILELAEIGLINWRVEEQSKTTASAIFRYLRCWLRVIRTSTVWILWISPGLTWLPLGKSGNASKEASGE